MTISVIRTIILYILVLILMRIMGKRQISDLQTSELVVTLLISNIAVIPMQDPTLPLVSGVIPIILLVGMEVLMSYFMMKNTKFRSLICGRPQIVIWEGKPDRERMKLLRMTTEDLFEQLRQQGVFALSDVRYAIIETNGTLSVMKKATKDTVTPEQLQLKNVHSEFEIVVISDGVIAENSMKLCHISQTQLQNILTKEKINAKDIFIMTLTPTHKYNIIKKQECSS